MSLTPLNPDEKVSPGLSPAETRRARQREEARHAILDATEALLLEAGGEAFGVRALAARCGYTAPTIYHYFGDKDGLIDALLEERVAVLADAIERVPVTRDALADLRAVLMVFVGFSAAHPTFDRLMWTVS